MWQISSSNSIRVCVARVFAQLDDEQRAEAMAELEDDKAAEIMGDMSETDASRMLSAMDPDDAAELVDELGAEKAEKLLKLMGVEDAEAIRQLLGYRDGTAGRIMTSEFLALPEDENVAFAINALRNLEEDFETVRYVYLVDDDERLAGAVTLNNLLVNNESTKLSSIASVDLVTAGPDDDQEDVAESISKYNLLALPIVSDEQRLLGIVTVDDALDVMEEEHEEDLQIAGVSSGGSNDDRGHDLSWLLGHELWFFFWIPCVGVIAAISQARIPAVNVLLACASLPIALILADDSVSYVTKFFIENDPDDEASPSMLGFTLKSLALGVAFAAIIVLFVTALINPSMLIGAGEADLNRALCSGFAGSVASTTVSFALTPIYLLVLRRRERSQSRDVGARRSRSSPLAIALVVFVAVAATITGPGVILV